MPFADDTFEVAMAILTVHHWSDPAAGLREMARVADRQVVFFFEPLRSHGFWATGYFPAARSLPTEEDPPGERLLSTHLDVQGIRPVLVPWDCQDGFDAAFYARPEAYLDPEVQAGMSWLAMLSNAERHPRLPADHRMALAGFEQRQHRLPAVGRDLERATLDLRRPEVVGLDGLEPEVFRVPPSSPRARRDRPGCRAR